MAGNADKGVLEMSDSSSRTPFFVELDPQKPKEINKAVNSKLKYRSEAA